MREREREHKRGWTLGEGEVQDRYRQEMLTEEEANGEQEIDINSVTGQVY